MFGYKVRLWNYNIFRIKECEEMLNRMAKMGYEFEQITCSLISLAWFKKSSKVTPRKYMVIPMDQKAKPYEMIELIEETDWKLIFNENEIAIFISEKDTAIPIFTDCKSKAEHSASSIKNSKKVATTIFMYLLIIPTLLWITWLCRYDTTLLAWCGFFIFIAVLILSDSILEIITQDKEVKAASLGIEYRRPKFVKLYHTFFSLTTAMATIAWVILITVTKIISGKYLFAAIAVLCGILFVISIYIEVALRNKKLGNIVFCLGTIGLISIICLV